MASRSGHKHTEKQVVDGSKMNYNKSRDESLSFMFVGNVRYFM